MALHGSYAASGREAMVARPDTRFEPSACCCPKSWNDLMAVIATKSAVLGRAALRRQI